MRLVEDEKYEYARADVSSFAISSLLNKDASSALEWIEQHGDKVPSQALMQITIRLAGEDISAARELLPKLSPEDRQATIVQMAGRMGHLGFSDEALSFIDELKGEPSYEPAKAQLIANIANSDLQTARQMAESISDPAARATAYAGVIQATARQDPRSALNMLEFIEDENSRRNLLGNVAIAWARRSPAEASNWARQLPDKEKIPAISAMANVWQRPAPEHISLVNSIQAEDQRFRVAWSVAASSRYHSKEWLDRIELPPEKKDQISTMVQEMRSQSLSSFPPMGYN